MGRDVRFSMRQVSKYRSFLSAITFVLAVALLLAALAQQSDAQRRQGKSAPGQSVATNKLAPASQHPRLVLLIVVDQFRYDYIGRFSDLFVSNGIRRLMKNGASWSQANYDHTPTYTAPGHATLMTGTWPSENGIVGNSWYERETGKRVSSVTDDTTLLLGGRENEKGASPRRLQASTIGEEMRLSTNDRAKVIGISLKSRSAILPAGQHANAAYWFSTNTGNIVSSTYYFNKLPDWVERFNKTRPADKYFGLKWNRLLPEAEYLKRAGPDAPSWENIGNAKDTNTFPHVITGGAKEPGRDFYTAIDCSPFGNDLLVEFAEQAIVNEGLGADDDTDLLSISLSSNDYVGHRFGPFSHEAMDMSLRVDRQIAELLNQVDARVGLQNTVVIFTADHGVAPIPEQTAAGVIPGIRIKAEEVIEAIKNAIQRNYAGKKNVDDYLQKIKINNADRTVFMNGNVYLNYEALERDGIHVDEIAEVVGEAAVTVPGIARFFTRRELGSNVSSANDDIGRRVLHGFYPQRSGDVILIVQPFSLLVTEPDDPADVRDPANHGSPYVYDTNVPLIFMGRNFRPGSYSEVATPADIAPTLANILGVKQPNKMTGRLLNEAIRK